MALMAYIWREAFWWVRWAWKGLFFRTLVRSKILFVICAIGCHKNAECGLRSADTQNAESQNADSQNAESQYAESQNADTQNADSQNAESQYAESQNADTQNADS